MPSTRMRYIVNGAWHTKGHVHREEAMVDAKHKSIHAGTCSVIRLKEINEHIATYRDGELVHKPWAIWVEMGKFITNHTPDWIAHWAYIVADVGQAQPHHQRGIHEDWVRRLGIDASSEVLAFYRPDTAGIAWLAPIAEGKPF